MLEKSPLSTPPIAQLALWWLTGLCLVCQLCLQSRPAARGSFSDVAARKVIQGQLVSVLMTDTGSPAWPRCIFAASVPPHRPCMIQFPACLMHSGSSYLVQAPKAALCVGCDNQHTLVPNRLHQHPLCVLWEVLRELHPACTQTDLLSQAAHLARALLAQLSHSGAESAFPGAPLASKLCTACCNCLGGV